LGGFETKKRRKSHTPEEKPTKLIDFGDLQGGSSSFRFLIWDPPKKETKKGGRCIETNWGGYRRPEVLVNIIRGDQKNEGPFGKKIARKSRNSWRMN